ncbi:MAG: 3-deoxy-D-manno-octulosonic acid transferase [Granulosicoccus sp.]|nr:3-deoxy-D-manno-octulosonic acid transferase [Granulosicoccus sp.]
MPAHEAPCQPAQEDQLWVHAASVGEVFTVLPLIKAWQSTTGHDSVLVTTCTPTGAAVLLKQALPGIRHQYLPVDFPGACRRFVAQLHTRHAWIVETEIWPWLYAQCQRRDMSMTIINGRLSRRTSAQSNGILASSYRRALASVRVLARSAQDVENFIALGAVRENVYLVGNLKYAALPISESSQALIERPYALAASTHDDEELQLARCWRDHGNPDILLVIVPRHPERGEAIHRDLSALGLSVARRSSGQQPAAGDQVYLADTLGELQAWYQFARATFVGGSLIARGGHNMLEPARYACPILVGPHTENFADIMQLMIEADAIEVSASAETLATSLLEAAGGSPHYREMGIRARAIAEDSQGILQRYLELLTATGDT